MARMVGFSVRALAVDECVQHGEGIRTHSMPNTNRDQDFVDEVSMWIVGEDIEAYKAVVLRDDMKLYQARASDF